MFVHTTAASNDNTSDDAPKTGIADVVGDNKKWRLVETQKSTRPEDGKTEKGIVGRGNSDLDFEKHVDDAALSAVFYSHDRTDALRTECLAQDRALMIREYTQAGTSTSSLSFGIVDIAGPLKHELDLLKAERGLALLSV